MVQKNLRQWKVNNAIAEISDITKQLPDNLFYWCGDCNGRGLITHFSWKIAQCYTKFISTENVGYIV